MDVRRILWLTENYPPQRGGMAQSCDRIIDGLRKKGYTIDIIHFTDRGAAYQTVQQLNGTYTAAPFEESESHTLNLTWNAIQTHSVDLLVCFGGYLPVLAAPVYAAWLSVPLLTLIRGNDFDSAIFTPRKRDLLRDAFEASQKICVVSSDKKSKIEKLFTDVAVDYIPNGIDAEMWKPSVSEIEFAQEWKNEIARDKLVVGIFGQLKAKKGIDFFIKALMKMEARANIHLLLIGELSEDVLQLLEQAGITHTHFLFMDRYELLRYYLCCDGIAIPSFYDGMPNVLLEAGALSIPVLASDTGGMRDVMKDGENGLLFDPGNLLSCRRALQTFAESSIHQREEWGAQLRGTVFTNFTNKHETIRYAEIIDTLLGAAGSSTLRVQSR